MLAGGVFGHSSQRVQLFCGQTAQGRNAQQLKNQASQSVSTARSIAASAQSTRARSDSAVSSTDVLASQSLDGDRVARISARRQHAHPVAEASRPLSEYMALPASQYSVLDARKIERLGDNIFRCYVGQLSILAFSVEPVIDVEVQTNERGCVVRLLKCKLEGSTIVDTINDQFRAGMENNVQWVEGDSESKAISSDTTVQVLIKVPGWVPIPITTVSRTGSAVLQQVLNTAVPRFLRELERDYNRWAAGDESRKPLGTGKL